MPAFTSLSIILIFASCLPIHETDAESLGSGPWYEEGLIAILEALINIPRTLLNPPENKNSSIGYRLYTTRSPKQPCFLEPNRRALRSCPIDASHLTIFLLHGFIVDLNPGNLFEVMKDTLLEKIPCNVIIVDWTKYDGPPYQLAISNIHTIGSDIAILIKYLVKYAGISTNNVILIGHSLGAHMAGAVGKNLPNLRRIDGLDPAGPFFETPIVSRLQYTDANFVQIIHTSNEIHGLGLEETLGHVDYYVNGGREQPHCEFGNNYRRPSGDEVTIDNLLLKRYCHHEISMQYYINSINSTDCTFFGTHCDNYNDFNEGKCPSENSILGVMGVYGSKIPNLPPLSRFYLRTSNFIPYCLKDGYKP